MPPNRAVIYLGSIPVAEHQVVGVRHVAKRVQRIARIELRRLTIFREGVIECAVVKTIEISLLGGPGPGVNRNARVRAKGWGRTLLVFPQLATRSYWRP